MCTNAMQTTGRKYGWDLVDSLGTSAFERKKSMRYGYPETMERGALHSQAVMS